MTSRDFQKLLEGLTAPGGTHRFAPQSIVTLAFANGPRSTHSASKGRHSKRRPVSGYGIAYVQENIVERHIASGEEFDQEEARQNVEPADEAAEVVAGGGKEGVDSVAAAEPEIIAAIRCSALRWVDRGTAAQLALDAGSSPIASDWRGRP